MRRDPAKLGGALVLYAKLGGALVLLSGAGRSPHKK